MNDNKPILLVYDREHHYSTEVETWVTSDGEMSFTFCEETNKRMPSVSFIDGFFKKPFSAIATYFMIVEGV